MSTWYLSMLRHSRALIFWLNSILGILSLDPLIGFGDPTTRPHNFCLEICAVFSLFRSVVGGMRSSFPARPCLSAVTGAYFSRVSGGYTKKKADRFAVQRLALFSVYQFC
jgi:hypothetical protein